MYYYKKNNMYAKIKFKSIKEAFLCGAIKLGIILYVFI